MKGLLPLLLTFWIAILVSEAFGSPLPADIEPSVFDPSDPIHCKTPCD
jgi:hypothetical protein